MSYEVLARKLRPSGFSALVGQEHVVRALQHGLQHDRLHHAYLFTGTRGVGKTTIARILAKCLNCETGVTASPCGQCSVCIEIKENRFMDLIEVDAASRTGVDDTRELLENAQYLPSRGRYKVYLIDEVHMLSTASFNALLKTLEEPPPHVKFLLATTDPKKVPVTVLSRCLQFQLKNLSSQSIVDYLSSVLSDEKVSFEAGALSVIARSAAGSMRDALSLTDQAIAHGQGQLTQHDVVDMLGVVGRHEVDTLLEGIAAGDMSQLLHMVADLGERNVDCVDVLKSLIEALHDLAVDLALGRAEASFSPEEVQLYYQIAVHGLRDIHLVPEPRSGLEMTLLRMLTFAPNQTSNVPPRGGQQTPSEAGVPSPSAEPAKRADTAAITDGPTAQAADVASPQPLTQAPGVDHSTPPAADELTELWWSLCDQLAIGGVSKMIAEHSVLEHYAPPHIQLCLEQGHDTLLNASQTEQLNRALEAVTGESLQLEVRIGEVQRETPARWRQRRQQERQADAEQAISEDQHVQGLLSEFGGSVDEVRPI